jgi:hypothetical protein
VEFAKTFAVGLEAESVLQQLYYIGFGSEGLVPRFGRAAWGEGGRLRECEREDEKRKEEESKRIEGTPH